MSNDVPPNLFANSDDKGVAEKIVRKLKIKGAKKDNPVRFNDLLKWLPKESNSRIERITRKLIDSNSAPVEGSVRKSVYLDRDFWEDFSPFNGSVGA